MLGAVDQAGSSVGWTYSVADEALDFLAAGQTRTQSYTITVDDGRGGTAQQTVTVTITGTNDAPTIVAAATTASATVTELSDLAPGENASTRTASGTIAFADIDTVDTHSATFTPQGSGYLGSFGLGAVNQGGDSVGWTFSAADGALDYLAAGQTRLQNYTVAVSDGKGGTVTQTVAVTLSGTNDAPTLAAGPNLSGAVSYYGGENNVRDSIGGNNGSAAGVGYAPGHDGNAFSFTGANFFTIANQIPANFTISGWLKTSAPSNAGSQFYHGNGLVYADVGGLARDFGISVLNNKLAFGAGGNFDSTILSTSDVVTGQWVNFAAVRSGSVISIYINGVQEASFDTTYAGLLNSPSHITVGANTVDGRYYNGLLDGLTIYNYAQSAAEITQHAILGTANMTERAGTTGSVLLDTAKVSVVLNDVDLADVHVASISAPALTVSGGGSAPAGLAAALAGAATTTLADSTGTGAGLVTVDFAAQDQLFDFLAEGQSLTVTYTLSVDDGKGGVATQPVSFIVNGTNDGPVVAAAIADQSVAEDSAWSFTVPAGAFADVDSASLVYTAALQGGAALPSWLSFDAASRTFSGTSPLDYNGQLALEVTASDGALSVTDAFNLDVLAVNDAPTIANLAGDAGTLIEPNLTSLIDIGANAPVADIDSANFNGGSLTAQIVGGYVANFDRVGIFNANGISSIGGIVTVNGVRIGTVTTGNVFFTDTVTVTFDTDDATAANVQALVRSLFYAPGRTEFEGGAGARTISVTLVDGDGVAAGGADRSTYTTTVTLVEVDNAPSGANATRTLAEDGSYTIQTADFGFSDADQFGRSDGNSFAGVRIASLPGAGQLLLDADGPGGAAPVAVSVGQMVSAADIAAGKLSFVPVADGNGNAYASFTFQVQDDGSTANGGQILDPTPNTLTFNVTPVDDAPVLNVVRTQATYVENAPALLLDSTLTLTDPDGPNLNGAVVSISGNYAAGQDSLAFTSLHGITGTFNAATGQLTLTGSASAAQYQEVLRSVTFSNSSDNPSVADRTITFAVTPNGAASQYFANNGHFYQYVQSGLISWSTAKAAAEASSLFGMKGYLATVTSAAENAFVIGRLQGNAWLGGSDAEVEGQWKWVTGPEAGTLFYTGLAGSGTTAPGAFSFWQGGEPNNFGNEDYLQYFSNGWNDLPNGGAPGYIDGYLIEYGGMPGDAPLALSDSIVVKLQAVNDAPTDVALSSSSVPENSGAGTVVGTLTGTDADSSAAQLSFTIVGGRSDLFAVSGSQLVVKAGAELDHEAVASHDVIVRVTDQAGLSFAKSLTIAVANVNEAPQWNVVANGDFERGPFVNNGHGWMSLAAGSTAIPGWTVTGAGGVDWHIAADTQGRLFLDLSGSAAGGVTQTLATVAGGVYRVDFDLAANPAYGSTETIRVVAAGTNETFVFNAAGRSLDAMGWTAKTVTFTATSSATALTFSTANADDSVGPALDNVRTTLVGFNATEDQALVSSVRATDPEGDALTYTRTANAANGNVVVSADGSFTYTPNANFAGTDSFTVQASDGKGGTSLQTFSVNVAAVNDAPVVTGAVTGSVNEDAAASTLNALGNASDVDSANLGVVNVPGTLPAGVTYDAAAKTFTLDPANAAYQSLAAGQPQVVAVSYGVSDGTTIVPASVSWTVTGTNDVPAISGDLAGSVTEALPHGGFDDFQAGTSGWTRIGGGTVPNEGPSGSTSKLLGRFGAENGAANGSEVVSKTFALDPSQAKTAISFDFLKLDSWDAVDGDGSGPNEELVVYLNGAQAFRFMPKTPVNGGFDNASGTFALAGGITGTYSVTSSGADSSLAYNSGWLDRVYKVSVVLDGAAATVKLGFGATLDQPISDESFGIDNVKVTHRLTDVGTIAFADPDLTDIRSASFAPAAGGYYGTFALGAVDQAGNSVGWTFTVDDSDIGWLAAGQSIIQTYAVTVSDGKGGTDVENVAVTITGTNDAPTVAVVIPDRSVAEDTAWTYTVPASTFQDVDPGTVLTYTAASPGGGALPSWLSFDGATRTFSGTPPANFNGTLALEVTASDGQLSVTDTFNLVVTPVNDAPSGTDISITINEDTAYVLTMADFGYGDVEGHNFHSFTLSAAPDRGTVTVNGVPAHTGEEILVWDVLRGRVKYTPDADANGTDALTFQVGDDGGTNNGGVNHDQSANTMAFVVNPVADAPKLANAIPDQSVAEDTAWSFQVPTGTFVEVDGQAITYSAALSNGLALPAWLSFNPATQTFSGTPPLDFNGTVALRVTASDGALSRGDDFVLAVTSVNDIPVIGGDLSGAAAEALPHGGSDDFSAGSAGWQLPGGAAAPTGTISPFGTFLGEFTGSAGGEQVSKTFALDPGQNLTRIAFDFLKLGSWDGQGVANATSNERLSVYINGMKAFDVTPEEWNTGVQPGRDNASGSFSLGGLTGTFTVTSAGVDVNRYDTSVDWGGSRSYHVEVLLSGSGSSVKLGFGNNLNGGFGDETLGIDNVLVTHRLTDSGAITFADPDTADVHVASFAANGAGYYGTFALGSVDQAGNSVGWTFAVDDSDIGWLPGGQTIVQTYAVTVNDGKGGTDVENVAVTITGRNDAPVIGGTSTGSVQEDGTLTASGLLTIADPDQGQSSFQAGTYQGLYGSAVLAANGSWTYTLANAASNVQALNAGQSVADSVAVKSADGTTYALSLTVAGAEDLAAVGTVVSRAIANGNHFHGSNGYVEVGPWGGGAETVRGAIEFDVTAGSFSTATFKFDVASVGGFSGTYSVYAYRADGVINVSDFNASGLMFVGSVHTSSLFAGAEPSFNATAALNDVFGAGTELGFLITYSGNTGSSYYFNNFELVIG